MIRVAGWLRDHGEHLVFGSSLAALALLATWWMTYLGAAVDLERDHALLKLAMATDLAAEALARGVDVDDTRLGIVRIEDAGPLASAIPGTSGDAVDVDPAVLAAVEATHARRKLMVWGEGSLLLLLIGATTAMLYRLVTARNALQREVLLFTGQMTHEMKTPLVGLKALLETIQKGRLPERELQEMVALGLEQVEREEHLVQTLLQAQRLRVAPEELRADAVDLAEVVRRFASHRDVGTETIRLTVDATDAPARGDADAVWTILENLVDNARKFGSTTIVLRTWCDGRHAYVSCEDDGRGFDPALSRRLFQPFKSAHADHAESHGSGLGLHICKRLARAMHGDLTATSAGEGMGARFQLTLPRVR